MYIILKGVKIVEEKIEKILKKVERPARYIGMEKNSTVKNWTDVNIKFAFSFPDVYEIAMSNLGMHILYNILNSEKDILCERVFAPMIDMERELREEGLPLFSLENKKSLKEFDFIGFTLQYELSYTNILNILDLSNINLKSKDRSDQDPIIIAGGPCVYNPEPLADIFDIFVIGEGEEIILELMDLYREVRDKEEFLRKALYIEGVYVPKYYRVYYRENGEIDSRTSLCKEAKNIIKKRIIDDLDRANYPKKIIVPYIKVVHDKTPLELFRGCSHGCRFCQAGMIYRPVRERSVNKLLEIAEDLVASTGYGDINLTSLSSCDYTEIKALIKGLIQKYDGENIDLSLPSIRMDSFSFELLKEIEGLKKNGLTFAPEAGSQRMRDVINKGVDYEDFVEAIQIAFKGGWSNIKLYFMLGLPTEEDEDVLGIKDMAYEVRDIFFDQEIRQGNLDINVSTSCFVPKAFTPFQWEKQVGAEEFLRRADLIQKNIFEGKIKYNYHDPKSAYIEGIIARGDRRLADLIIGAFEKGARFDGWTEYFDYSLWEETSKDIGIDLDFYTRKRGLDEILPWDFIDIGVEKDYLKKEYKKSLTAELTRDCRKGCTSCGIEKSFGGGLCLENFNKI